MLVTRDKILIWCFSTLTVILICLVISSHHTKILRYNWLYFPHYTFHCMTHFVIGNLYIESPSVISLIPPQICSLVTNNLFSVSINLICGFFFFFKFLHCFIDSTYKRNHMVFFFLWLISFSIVHFRSLLWLSIVQLYLIFFMYLSVQFSCSVMSDSLRSYQSQHA